MDEAFFISTFPFLISWLAPLTNRSKKLYLVGAERLSYINAFVAKHVARDPHIESHASDRPQQRDLDLEAALLADEEEYYVNPSAAACYN